MQQFTLIGANGNEMSFTFNSDGLLLGFMASADITPEPLEWIVKRMPTNLEALRQLAQKIKAKLIETPLDLSFETFWQSYDYKVGGREKTRKMWESLSESDKAMAMIAVPRYKRWLKVKNGIEQAYPSTWLSQRRFENDFKA